MKTTFQIIAMILTLLMLGACGTSAAETEQESADTVVSAQGSIQEAGQDLAQEPESSAAWESLGMESVDMLYYLDLGQGSIMAACYEEKDVAQLGADYYVVHLGDAEIYNAQGQACTLQDLPRGCPLRIEWPGMVMESYPGQIAAVRVTAISDEADPSVPPEEEIPAGADGIKWWVREIPKELPGLNLEYSTEDFSVAMFLGGVGSWGYMDGDEAVETISCGDDPVEREYHDNNTCKRAGYDTVRFSCGQEPEAMTVRAYVDGSREAVEVPVAEDGSIELLDGGEVIYVVNMSWDTPEYWGNGEYAVKIVAAS